jgi:hypothetical protein
MTTSVGYRPFPGIRFGNARRSFRSRVSEYISIRCSGGCPVRSSERSRLFTDDPAYVWMRSRQRSEHGMAFAFFQWNFRRERWV